MTTSNGSDGLHPEAYAQARAAIKTGQFVKLAAVVVGGGITIFSAFVLCVSVAALAGGQPSAVGLALGIAGVCGGVVSGIALYAAGVLVTSAGHMLTATLDTAGHTAALGPDSRVIAFRPNVVRERADHAP